VRQRQRGGARPDSLTKHGVETEILQRRIERFLDDGVQAVDLVDEEDVAGGEVQKNRSQRALVVDGRAGAHLDGDAELVGDDVGERGLAKAGRPAQQDMLHGLAPAASRLQQDAEVVPHLLLADVLGEDAWAERQVELVVVGSRVQDRIVSWRHAGHFLPSALSASASAF